MMSHRSFLREVRHHSSDTLHVCNFTQSWNFTSITFIPTYTHRLTTDTHLPTLTFLLTCTHPPPNTHTHTRVNILGAEVTLSSRVSQDRKRQSESPTIWETVSDIERERWHKGRRESKGGEERGRKRRMNHCGDSGSHMTSRPQDDLPALQALLVFLIQLSRCREKNHPCFVQYIHVLWISLHFHSIFCCGYVFSVLRGKGKLLSKFQFLKQLMHYLTVFLSLLVLHSLFSFANILSNFVSLKHKEGHLHTHTHTLILLMSLTHRHWMSYW